MENIISEENLSDFLVPIVLKLIQTDVIFQKEFAEFAPEIKDKIASYKDNPNCSCRNDITAYCSSNPDKTKQFVSKFISNNLQVKKDIDDLIKENPSIYIGGKIFEIEDSDKAYNDFYINLIKNKYTFRSFSILKTDNKLKFYFI